MSKELLLFLLLLTLSCHSNSNNDTIIQDKDVSIRREIILEEFDEVFLSSLTSSDISDDNQKLLISDNNTNLVIEYDYTNGKILKYYQPTESLSDTFALSNRWVKPRNNLRYKMVTLNTAKTEYEFDDKSKNLLIHNRVQSSFYKENDVYVLAVLNTVSVPADTFILDRVILNTAALIKLNENFHVDNVTVFENAIASNGMSVHSMGYEIIPLLNENKYLLTCCDYPRQYERGISDSLPALSYYNSKGDFISIASYLPWIHEYSKLGYFVFWKPYVCKHLNDVWVSYPLNDTIENLTTGFKFGLKNKPSSNNDGFEYCRMNPGSQLNYFQMIQKFPLYVSNIFPLDSTLVVQLTVTDSDGSKILGKKIHLQEYSYQGKLLAQAELLEDLGTITEVNFDKNNNLYVIYKNKEKGWILTERSWK
jgi:hypothetical protein